MLSQAALLALPLGISNNSAHHRAQHSTAEHSLLVESSRPELITARQRGNMVDSRIKSIRNEDKYRLRHHLNNRTDETGKGRVGKAYTLVGIHITWGCSVELTKMKQAWHFKAEKAVFCSTIRNVSDPSKAVNLVEYLWRARNKEMKVQSGI